MSDTSKTDAKAPVNDDQDATVGTAPAAPAEPKKAPAKQAETKPSK